VEVKKVIAEVKKPLAKKEEIKFDPKPKKEILPVKEKAKKTLPNQTNIEIKYRNSFEKKFYTSKDNSFTINMASVPKSRLKGFINRYILDDKYLVKKKNNNYQIVYGIYKNKKEAQEAILNLHPKILDSVSIISIKSVK
jgi:septal ring-binding cell division protein DamX